MSEVLVSVSGVSKKFSKTLRHSMIYGLGDISRNVLGMSAKVDSLRAGEFWAINDVSFEVKRGECLGVIGPNGAGKTTLLKLLNGIIPPDRGRIELCGRVGGIIELGAGFHSQLTGRENIYVNGSILGFRKSEMEQKLDAIIDFAGIGDFIDSPVKYYSSGMYLRLGFAIAAQIEPDILLIDEILAVGDAGFRAKCYDLIYSKLKNTAVILVSHDMTHINRMCTAVVLLEDGKVNYFVAPADGIEAYFDITDRCKTTKGTIHSDGNTRIENISIKGMNGNDKIFSMSPLGLSFEVVLLQDIEQISIVFSILSRDLTPVAISKFTTRIYHKTNSLIEFDIPQLFLAPGKYSLSIALFDEKNMRLLYWLYNTVEIKVYSKEFDYNGVPVILPGTWSIN